MRLFWNKYLTFFVRFTLVKYRLKVKEFTGDNGNNYVSTFVISKGFWFLENRREK